MTKITALTAANIAASLNMIVPTMTATLKPPRVDIQALRGLAVLTVVLYHAKNGGLQAGFLDVDIFFVISGFLITTLVATGIHRGTFTLSEFYFRRAKRLLPAAYVTFFVTAACAPFIETPGTCRMRVQNCWIKKCSWGTSFGRKQNDRNKRKDN